MKNKYALLVCTVFILSVCLFSHVLTFADTLEEIGIDMIGIVTVQGTVNANNTDSEKEDVTDGNYLLFFFFSRSVGDNGFLFADVLAGDGTSVEDELALYSNVNRNVLDTNNTLNLVELWYAHYFFEKQLTFRIGKIYTCLYVDQNRIANNEWVQFIGRDFRNASTIDFPGCSFGVHFFLAPDSIPWLELEMQAVDGNTDWEDIGDDTFATYQVNIKPQLESGLIGNYRIYGWSKTTDYTLWDDFTETNKHRSGYGINFDQQLTDTLTIFGRYGWADPKVFDPAVVAWNGANYTIEHAWSAGFQVDGKAWNREGDHIGVAYGVDVPSEDYKDAVAGSKAENEQHAELYYAWRVNEYLLITPDIQVIWNPFGDDNIIDNDRRDATVTVIGCRLTMDF